MQPKFDEKTFYENYIKIIGNFTFILKYSFYSFVLRDINISIYCSIFWKKSQTGIFLFDKEPYIGGIDHI